MPTTNISKEEAEWIWDSIDHYRTELKAKLMRMKLDVSNLGDVPAPIIREMEMMKNDILKLDRINQKMNELM